MLCRYTNPTMLMDLAPFLSIYIRAETLHYKTMIFFSTSVLVACSMHWFSFLKLYQS
jgi:hypothetical protein